MAMVLVKGRIVGPGEIAKGWVAIEGGIIREIGSGKGTGGEVYDYGERLILPGFIDVHMHAMGEYSSFETDELVKIAQMKATYGTTGFLGTEASLTTEGYLEFGKNVRQAMQLRPAGAKVLGAHFEGPFINPAKKGGMRAEFLQDMDAAVCRRFVDEVGDVLKLMTLSPELAGAVEVIRMLRANGTVVSVGHSRANGAELAAAVEAGLSQVCHMFDAYERGEMLEGWQWQPGLMEEVLLRDELYGEVICDMQHVLPPYVRLAAKVLGPDRFVAITDSLRGAGCEPGEYYMVDGREFSTRSGLARLTSNNDVVGSVLTMNKAFANLVEVCGVDPVTAAKFTATNPARALEMEGEMGSIEVGKTGDLAVLDGSFNCVGTFVDGVKIYGD